MAAPNTYDVGDSIRCTIEFRTIAGVLTDPTKVYFKYQDPSGNEITLEYGVDVAVVRDAMGLYHSDISIDEEGWWYYRWEGTGVLVGACEFYFMVRDSKFTP